VNQALDHPWIHHSESAIVKMQSLRFLNWMDTESEADSAVSESRQQKAGLRHELRSPTVHIVEIMQTEEFRAF
jgi:hypothetical protein